MSKKRVLLTTDSNENIAKLFDENLRIAEIKGLSKYTIKFYKEGYRMFNKFIDIKSSRCRDMNNKLVMN